MEMFLFHFVAEQIGVARLCGHGAYIQQSWAGTQFFLNFYLFRNSILNNSSHNVIGLFLAS